MKTKKKIPLLPARIRPGDKIGVVAPAGSFEKKTFFEGIRVLESMGFIMDVPADIFQKDRYLAGPDQHRADSMNRLFADKTVKAVICARGGYGSLRLLPLLDYKIIKKNPKVFVGFSDITALLSILYSQCGLVAFHGPMATTLGTITKKSQNALFAALTAPKKIRLATLNGVVIKPGSASGTVWGGNLTTLCHLVGTPYAPRFKGCILMLEDIGEPAYRIDRMLTHMKFCGCFDGIAGLALGSFKDCGSKRKIHEVVADIFGDKKIPILAGFEVGHGRGNMTFPIGLEATLDTNRNSLWYHDAATIAY